MKKIFSYKRKDRYFTAIYLSNMTNKLGKYIPVSDIEDYLYNNPMSIVQHEEVKSTFWWRLTLPIIFIIALLGWVLSPLLFILFGKWNFPNEFLSTWATKAGLN